jgi:hypothetical protein
MLYSSKCDSSVKRNASPPLLSSLLNGAAEAKKQVRNVVA